MKKIQEYEITEMMQITEQIRISNYDRVDELLDRLEEMLRTINKRQMPR
jgi:hypothetical protein